MRRFEVEFPSHLEVKALITQKTDEVGHEVPLVGKVGNFLPMQPRPELGTILVHRQEPAEGIAHLHKKAGWIIQVGRRRRRKMGKVSHLFTEFLEHGGEEKVRAIAEVGWCHVQLFHDVEKLIHGSRSRHGADFRLKWEVEFAQIKTAPLR